jgi:hypothetical protein
MFLHNRTAGKYLFSCDKPSNMDQRFYIFKYSVLDDNKTNSRSEWRVVDPLVEMAQLFTMPLSHAYET